MDYCDLTISVSIRDGIPLMSVRGTVDGWHARSLDDLMDEFVQQDTPALTLDVSGARFADAKSLSSFIRTLRVCCLRVRIAVIGSEHTSAVLRLAGLEQEIAIHSNTDRAEEPIRSGEGHLTSRQMARTSREEEQPLAA